MPFEFMTEPKPEKKRGLFKRTSELKKLGKVFLVDDFDPKQVGGAYRRILIEPATTPWRESVPVRGSFHRFNNKEVAKEFGDLTGAEIDTTFPARDEFFVPGDTIFQVVGVEDPKEFDWVTKTPYWDFRVNKITIE